MTKVEPRRILVVRNDRLGDTILTLPAIAALKRLYPRAHCAVLAHPAMIELLECVPEIDELLADDGATRAGQLARRLRAGDFDTALVINTNTRNALAVWRAGIGRRVMWSGKPLGRLLGNLRVDVRRSHPPIHEAEFALKFVERLAGRPVRREPVASPSLPHEVQRTVSAKVAGWRVSGRPCCVVHPGNRGSAYNWPAYRYAELVRALDRFCTVLVSGGPDEASLVREVIRLAGDRGTPVVGLSLLEFTELLRQVDVLTVSSTGPMHVAGWVGTPLVAIFSAHPVHSPLKWAPLGDRQVIVQPKMAASADDRVREHPGQMDSISVERVLHATCRMLEGEQTRSHTA